MTPQPVSDTCDHPNSEEEFRRLCLLQVEMLAREGFHVRAFRGPDLPLFSKLSNEKKLEAISDIQTTVEIYNATREDGYELLNSPRLLWRGLQRFGWVPQNDIFDKISDGDVVKIYSPNQKLVFCNLNFYKWITYSLEEIYTGYWFNLIKFGEDVITSLYQAMADAISGARESTFTPDLPEHVIEVPDEMLEPEKRSRFWSRIAYLSPLKKTGEVVGVLAICRCREVR